MLSTLLLGERVPSAVDPGLEDILSADDLATAAEDVLLQQQPSARLVAVLAEHVPPSRHLVMRVCNAFDEACAAEEVVAAMAATQMHKSCLLYTSPSPRDS